VVSLREAVSEVFEATEQAVKEERLLMGIPTGFHELDNLLNGLNKQRFIIVGGRPAMGKSSFLLNIALHAARLGKRVFYWTGEMSATDNAIRLMSGETGIKAKDIQSGNLDLDEWRLFVEATGKLADLPLWIDPTPGITPQQLKARLIRQQILHGVDLIIVDYLQLMTSGGENRVQEVSRISQALKGFSKTFNVPVLAAAQLSRELERRQDKRPMLSDLKESGSLEQDADVVAFIYRDEVYNPESEYPNQAEIIVAKHRQGATDTVSLYWDRVTTRFLNGRQHNVNLKGYSHDSAE
jgi:replicative DNA helicase